MEKSILLPSLSSFLFQYVLHILICNVYLFPNKNNSRDSIRTIGYRLCFQKIKLSKQQTKVNCDCRYFCLFFLAHSQCLYLPRTGLFSNICYSLLTSGLDIFFPRSFTEKENRKMFLTEFSFNSCNI